MLPSKLSSGGFSGIATILYYFFNIKMGTSIILMNIPLYMYSLFKIGKGFTIKSLFATVLYSKLIDYFSTNILIEDRFLACIYGGILVGIGLALVLKADASTGGTDLLAHIALERQIKAKISDVIMLVDIFVVLVNLIVFKELEIGLYSFIVIWIISKMIDSVFEGINFSKIIYIITDEHEKMAKSINCELDKGATSIYAKGTYSGKNKMILMCTCSIRDVENIKKIVRKIDKNSFMIIANAREVYGLGFKT